MKAGAEIHFLSGQIFMLGVTLLTVSPRLPFDKAVSIGGKLSFPFRRALIWLMALGIVRTLSCHLHHPDSSVLAASDAVLGTIQVVGQVFLCLTTAYILQSQMSSVINIEGGAPGRSLIPFLVWILLLSVISVLFSAKLHPNWCCLESLAEAASCIPVLKTLKTYASLTNPAGSRREGGRGPVLMQTLVTIEYWYMTTALVSFVVQATGVTNNDLETASAMQMILEAIRKNQDNGVDDWTRLLLHAVFLNTMDELQHFTGGLSNATTGEQRNGTARTTSNTDEIYDTKTVALISPTRRNR